MRHCSRWHSCCSWRFLVPGVITVLCLPAITAVPGVVGVPTVALVTAVAGVLAVTGVLAVVNVPANHGVPILVGFLHIVLSNDILDYPTIGLWLSDCYFFLLWDYRNIEYWTSELEKLSDIG